MIKKLNITILHLIPSLLELLVNLVCMQDTRKINWVVTGGESLSKILKERFFKKLSAQLYHAYGPTESSISVTHWDCKEKRRDFKIPIGKL